MEKLIELLNEYNKEKTNGEIGWRTWRTDEDFGNLLYGHYNGGTFSEMYCISKRYGFIKWLVENDKIDFSLIPNKIKEIGIPMKINGEIKYGFDSSDYYWLLMLLSISDTPIDDLISYLR